LTGTDGVLADLAQWAGLTPEPVVGAAPALRVLTVSDGPGGAVVADVGALATRLEGLAEDITFSDLDDVAQPRSADVAEWPLLRAARCGDGLVDAGEACDGTAGCDSNCQGERPTGCGDGVRDPSEQCDLGADRNALALDCNPGCQVPSVDVPAGAYTIGAPPDAAGVDAHETPPWRMLTAAFRIQKTEVTRALYAQVMGRPATTSRLPQTDVRWEDANTFCARVGGRLPTEAEWEAAARSVSPPGARFPWGDDPAGAAGRAWVGGVALHEVASASAPGTLPDIAGNAWEWTSDCWHPEIYEDRARGRVGVPSPRSRWCQPYVGDGDVEIAEPKVARGGAASVGVEAARITNRRVVSPTADGVGLRCVWGGDPKEDDGLRWVHVPEGPHWIGAAPGDAEAHVDERPGWEATFPGGFEILATEVPSALKPGFAGTWEKGRLPWANVNWAEAKAFCETNGARLPTEVEWEAAARGGTRTLYGCGEEAACLDGSAWWSDNAGGKAHRVGTRAPNAWGVHDAYGSVWEWVEDCYREGAWGRLSTISTNPGVVDMPECGARVVRGGSFYYGSWYLRASNRLRDGPSIQGWYFGFRCVRGVRRQSLLVP
jgi:formylglycine-generating enzyme required for sulfatase activity